MGDDSKIFTTRKGNQVDISDVALTGDDFRFAYHRDPERFMRVGNRPLRLIHTKPEITTYSDVIYTPATYKGNTNLGCLYRKDMTRIEDSVLSKQLSGKTISSDPKRLSMDTSELRVYDRPVLYLGLLQAHFGHHMLENLGRWWVLTEESGDFDKYLFHVHAPRQFEIPFVKTSLKALGIDQTNLVYFEEPVILRKVIVPATSFELSFHVHTKYKEIANRLARALGAEAVAQSDQPVFLSRTKETRGIRIYAGEEEVERFLAARGVRIAYPGQMSFIEQVKLINTHKCIVGFQGSQLLSINMALQPKTVIEFTNNRVAYEQLLLNKCMGHEATFVNVCDWDSLPREVYRKLVRKLTGRWVRRNGFIMVHRVDYDKITTWLKESGLLSS